MSIIVKGKDDLQKKERVLRECGTWDQTTSAPEEYMAFKCVFLEIWGIPYMKKSRNSVKFRNFTELYVTEFGGIPPELQPIPHGIRNRRK